MKKLLYLSIIPVVLALSVPSLIAQTVYNLPTSRGGALVTYTGTTNYSTMMATANTSGTAKANLPESENAFPMRRPVVNGAGQAVVRHNPAMELMTSPASTLTSPLLFGFTGLRHVDTRTARAGNQFSITPPDQALAAGNGFVLEAVNCVLGIYDTNGDLIVPAASANTEPMALTTFFGLPPAIDRTTGVQHNNPGDVFALFDSETSRWFVTAWAQNVDTSGNPKPSSRAYLAVSQTSDPTGSWYQYTLSFSGVVPDYAKLGLDHNGLWFSSNNFSTSTGGLVGAFIAGFRKSDLESGLVPTFVSATIPFSTGYEFTVFPQVVPPGTPYVTANGGTMYFVSSQFVFNTECTMGVWAATNTNALNVGGTVFISLGTVNTQCYNYPSQEVLQQAGFRPLGTSLGESLETLDSGDFRVQSLTFTNSNLFVSLPTEVTDTSNNQVMGAAWFVFHPTISGHNVSATVTSQGIINLNGASFLRPNLAMNSSLQGVMVGSIVGTSNFPSAGYVTFTNFSPTSVVLTSRTGFEPQDDFSGYAAYGGAGTARWGDYEGVVVDADGTFWAATEYNPDIFRTLLANWATYVAHIQLNHN